MSTPSLLNIPYVIKAGTLYSQIPETGAGDFTVTRATTPTANLSTRINANGFIELVNDGVPRLDYPLGGAVNGCASLLVEPSAQNLALQSAFATSWSTGGGATITPNSATSPENQNTAAKLNVVTTTFSSTSRTLTTVSGTVYTVSVFAKKDTKNWIYFVNLAGSAARVWFNVASGTIGTIGAGISNVTIENYGNGWYRCRWTETAGGTTSYFQVGATDADNTNTPTSSGSVFLWGAQLETGSIATSYIPTTTQAITRGADVINKTGIASLIGQSEGTIYAEVDIRTFANIGMIATISDGTASNRIDFYKYTDSRIYFDRISSTQSAATGLGSAALTAGIFKVAVAYKSGDTTMYINGAQIGTTQTQTFTFAALTKITIGVNRADNALFFNDRIRAVAIYPNRLTNSQLQTLTTP